MPYTNLVILRNVQEQMQVKKKTVQHESPLERQTWTWKVKKNIRA